MYKDFRTWNPFKGCSYGCSYCVLSFQSQNKRLQSKCEECGSYLPHFHPERLETLPSSSKVFACGNSDISLCSDSNLKSIISVIWMFQEKTFLLQSKDPSTFRRIKKVPPNLILGTTIETNRDDVYDGITLAPPPKGRIKSLRKIKHHRKMVTIEPIMRFDLKVILRWMNQIKPEYIWIGVDTRDTPGVVSPSIEEIRNLYDSLIDAQYTVDLSTKCKKMLKVDV